MIDQRGATLTEDRVCSINQGGCEASRTLVDRAVLETIIVILSDEEGDKEHPAAKPNKVVEEDEVKPKDLRDEKLSGVNVVKSGEGEGSGSGSGSEDERLERVCRICQLSSELLFETTGGTNVKKEIELIQLGCGCKDEMGSAHSHCAETWFKLKGNRICEICGKAAENITGIRDQRLMEEWNEARSNVLPGLESREGCWRSQPYCNFLMACLVIAFVLPWFLRVNWFT